MESKIHHLKKDMDIFVVERGVFFKSPIKNPVITAAL